MGSTARATARATDRTYFSLISNLIVTTSPRKFSKFPSWSVIYVRRFAIVSKVTGRYFK